MATPLIICIEPLSPTYSTLPRYNTIVLLLFLLLAPSDSWATKGALAALMTRTATIAFHAFSIIAIILQEYDSSESRPHALDLDVLGAWVILSGVGAAMPILLGWAPALKGSKARTLVRLWGILVIVAAVCAFAGVMRSASRGSGHTDQETCSNVQKSPLRTSEAALFDATKLFERLGTNQLTWKFEVGALVVLGFGIWSCFRKGSVGSQKGVKFNEWLLYIERAGLLFAAVIVPAIMVLHEMLLLRKPAIPMLEGLRSFEQWDCWAATGLVVLATVINWVLGRREAQKIPTQYLLDREKYAVEMTSPSSVMRERRAFDVLVEPSPTHIR